ALMRWRRLAVRSRMTANRNSVGLSNDRLYSCSTGPEPWAWMESILVDGSVELCAWGCGCACRALADCSAALGPCLSGLTASAARAVAGRASDAWVDSPGALAGISLLGPFPIIQLSIVSLSVRLPATIPPIHV